jgi:uncharacterized protein with FMN-binding domain
MDAQTATPTAPDRPEATPSPAPAVRKNTYRNGEFTGDRVDAYYGIVQVKITMTDGKISDVRFLDYPRDRRTSERISAEAMPILKSEAIQSQSADVDIVSGATQTSLGFRESLASALKNAKN